MPHTTSVKRLISSKLFSDRPLLYVIRDANDVSDYVCDVSDYVCDVSDYVCDVSDYIYCSFIHSYFQKEKPLQLSIEFRIVYNILL